MSRVPCKRARFLICDEEEDLLPKFKILCDGNGSQARATCSYLSPNFSKPYLKRSMLQLRTSTQRFYKNTGSFIPKEEEKEEEDEEEYKEEYKEEEEEELPKAKIFCYRNDSKPSYPSPNLTKPYDLEFVRALADYLKCPVCFRVLREPHLTSCCGDLACADCVTDNSKKGLPCPMCHEPNFTSLFNRKLQNNLNTLKVYCPLKKEGCKWLGEQGKLENHLNAASLDGECKFLTVPCPNKCERHVMRFRIEKHKCYCSMRPYQCKLCTKSFPFKTIEKHYEECPESKITCCYCDTYVQKYKLASHLTVCPFKKIECKFKFVGCNRSHNRNDSDGHMKRNAGHHVSLLADYVKEKIQGVDRATVALRAKIESERAKRKKLQKETEWIKQKVLQLQHQT